MNPIPERVIGPDALNSTSAVLARHGLGKKLLIACDDQTWVAAGQQLQLALNPTHEIIPFSFGREIRATMKRAQLLIEAANDVDGLIAVGSGTVNDLTKYAAAQLNKPYLSVATAASMNGYTSATASLEEEKFKHSHPAKPPLAVIADLSVLTAAPKRLARAGFGDTLCRSTVEADMIISHHLRGTPYPKAMFDRMRGHEQELLNHASAVREHRPEKIELLMTALLDAGDAMAEHGSSAVASQGEHMIAHTAEMIYGTEVHDAPHGEIIAVTTLTMAHLQQRMLRIQPSVRPLPRELTRFERVFGKVLAPSFMAAYEKKLFTPEEAEHTNQMLLAKWEAIKQAISDNMIPPITLERVFKLLGLPTDAIGIKLEPVRYENAVYHAHLTRDRFTFLDLAAMNDKRA